LEELKKASDIVPALNQVEWHPKSRDYNLLKYCKDNNIILQAYSSLGSYNTTLRNDPVVNQIATDLGKSSSQILLRWATQNGIAIIPKATSKKHLEENLSLDFVIPENQMTTLDKFEQIVSLFNRNPADVIWKWKIAQYRIKVASTGFEFVLLKTTRNVFRDGSRINYWQKPDSSWKRKSFSHKFCQYTSDVRAINSSRCSFYCTGRC
jgi:hypothetical protein